MARIARTGESAPLTLTQPDSPTAGGMTTRSGAKRAPEGAAPLPAGRRRERGETPRPYIELRAIRPVPKSREAQQAFLDTKNIAYYPPKTTLGFYPQRSEFWGDIR